MNNVNTKKNASRKRITAPGGPNDIVPIHIKCRRSWHDEFQRLASADPVHAGMTGVIKALVEGWMEKRR